MMNDINSFIESYKLGQDSEKKKSIIDFSFNISLKLITNVQFNDNSFHEFLKVSNNFSEIIYNEYDSELLIAYLNILFSAAENVKIN